MKLHVIKSGNYIEYYITNSYNHEIDIQKRAAELENKKTATYYDVVNIDSHHLQKLFDRLNEDVLGYNNICYKLYEIIEKLRGE